MNYYFEIFDNDGINGPKSTKSQVLIMIKTTVKQLENKKTKTTKILKTTYSVAAKDAQKLAPNKRNRRKNIE